MKNTAVQLFCLLLIQFAGLFTCFPGYSQSANYDEIYNSLATITPKQAYDKLFEYRSQFPKEANTYIQLAHVTEQMVNQTDPFKEFGLLNYHIENAITYYNIFPFYLTEGEVKRNKEFYNNIPVEANKLSLTNEGLTEYATHKVNYLKELKQKADTTYNAIKKSKNHYNRCVEIFIGINNSFNNYNEALLKTDKKFLGTLDELEREFKATIKAFEDYKTLLGQLKLGNYNQQYSLLPITTFRLEGITNSDFFEPQFSMWDYGKWVTDYRNIYTSQIQTLRNEVVEIQKRFDSNLKTLTNPGETLTEKPASFDEYFLYKLGRFDSNSLIRELFTYGSKRQDYLWQLKNPLNTEIDSNEVLLSRKLRFYFRLSQDMLESQASLDVLNNAITDEKIERFYDFFNTYYGGNTGLKNYKKEQVVYLENRLNIALQNLNDYLRLQDEQKLALPVAEGKKDIKISLIPGTNEHQPTPDAFVTSDIFYSNNKPEYVAGYQMKPKTSAGFVSRIVKTGKIEWIKLLEPVDASMADLNHEATKVLGFEKGLIVLLTVKKITDSENSENHHNLIFLDTLGNIKKTVALENRGFPLLLAYDEINQLCHLAFGIKSHDNTADYSNISICQIDSTGIRNWNTDFKMVGQLAGFVKTGEKYSAYFNFKNFKINGQNYVADENGTNYGLIFTAITNNGTVTEVKPIVPKGSLIVDKVFQLSGSEMNLIGSHRVTENAEPTFAYFVVSADNNLLFSNIKTKNP